MPPELPAGAVCYIDANILYYAFVEVLAHGVFCRELLDRVRSGDIEGVTDTRAMADAVHKAMMAEIANTQGVRREKLIGAIKRNPQWLARLPRTVEFADQLGELRLRVLVPGADVLPLAVGVAQESGLLTSDAIMVVLMRQHGITWLATNDDDFDRVPDLTLWKPR